MRPILCLPFLLVATLAAAPASAIDVDLSIRAPGVSLYIGDRNRDGRYWDGDRWRDENWWRDNCRRYEGHKNFRGNCGPQPGRGGDAADRDERGGEDERHADAAAADQAASTVLAMSALMAAASTSITSTRWGSASMFSSPAGRAGLRPSASTMVSSNLAGWAVSSTRVGTAGSRSSRATLRPSAVWVSITVA